MHDGSSPGEGVPMPAAIENRRILVLACGSGHDVFLASALVGAAGTVIGVDASARRLEVARRERQFQAWRHDYAQSNVDFRLGDVNDLLAAGVVDETIDVAVSAALFAPSVVPEQAFREVHRVLRPGGELLLSGTVASRTEPRDGEPASRGYGMTAPPSFDDVRRVMADAGWSDLRVVSRRRMPLDRLASGAVEYAAVTLRAFKLAGLAASDDHCGHVARYLGTVCGQRERFDLDVDHVFDRDAPVAVGVNTAAILSSTRYARHFAISGGA